MRTRNHVDDMEIEHVLRENLELRARNADLELERDTCLVYFKATLHELHKAKLREQSRRDDDQRTQAELRDLRAMVVAECYDDAAAVLGVPVASLPVTGSDRPMSGAIQ
jgi:hypothetical protein